MKTTALIVICILGLCLLDCKPKGKYDNHHEGTEVLYEIRESHNELPPKYKMTCDGNGCYIPVMPYGTEIIDWETNKPFNSRQKAIDAAWKQYESKPPLSLKYNWPECE